MAADNKTYKFKIQLSVLNHLGRNLYRNFITVLGEAISNSWDADAKNVWIEIDKDNKSFTIRDDGVGMDEVDFENKFLAVGYSKRASEPGKKPKMESPGGRPFIGAKGIGKLALLSCSKVVSIISKKKDSADGYVGGVINNDDLDDAIKDDLPSSKYPLGKADQKLIQQYEGQEHGTIIQFRNLKPSMKNTIPYLKKTIAFHFRFSLIDDDFKIHLNGEQVSLEDLKELSEATEFLWNINDFKDPFINTLKKLRRVNHTKIEKPSIKGFIATVYKPKNLKVTGTEERVGVDLFVNGRLRERDLLKRVPTARIPESYTYGQIHFDELDADGEDRFTTSREGILAIDKKYPSLLNALKSTVSRIFGEWDKLRLEMDEEGDDENEKTRTLIRRRARAVYNLLAQGFKVTPKSNKWVKELGKDAEFNIQAYTECFISENLLRKYIDDKQIDYKQSSDIVNKIKGFRKSERKSKAEGNINIPIRKNNNDLSYLDMEDLADLAENPPGGIPNTTSNSVVTDGKEYKPIRNAVMHTALITNKARLKLTTVYNNIGDRVKDLLSKSP